MYNLVLFKKKTHNFKKKLPYYLKIKQNIFLTKIACVLNNEKCYIYLFEMHSILCEHNKVYALTC